MFEGTESETKYRDFPFVKRHHWCLTDCPFLFLCKLASSRVVWIILVAGHIPYASACFSRTYYVLKGSHRRPSLFGCQSNMPKIEDDLY